MISHIPFVFQGYRPPDDRIDIGTAAELLGWPRKEIRSRLGTPPYSPELIDIALDDAALMDSGGGSGWLWLTQDGHQFEPEKESSE